MRKYFIEPEVAGELGEETQMNSLMHPPIVKKLHYHFYGWLGDELLECFPCYIVSEKLKSIIEAEAINDITFEDVVITVTDDFQHLTSYREMPVFFWLKFKSNADISLSSDYRLVVSEKLLKIIRIATLNNAVISPCEDISFNDECR